MKLLLDTHILLWALSNDKQLSETARELIEAPENSVFFSVISLWEVEIKHIAHKDKLPLDAEELRAYCDEAGFSYCGIKDEHIYHLKKLKQKKNSPEHKDPFDRILLCQAAVDSMTLLTHDKRLRTYTEKNVLYV